MSSTTAATPEAPQAAPATYERTSGNGPMGNHPQLQQVIDAILKGESCNGISKWVSPPVSRFTIAKLAEQVRQQRDAAVMLAKAQQLQRGMAEVSENGQQIDELTKAAVVGSRHLSRLEELYEPLARQVALADADNDRMGLATVAKAAISAIRTQAELDGSLLSTSVNQSVTQNILILPFGQPQADQPTPAIDTTAEPIDA